ncbi:MAG: pyruvate ferredoxin oxidoreductase [Deltaproteobacteria bacterium]|nr:pyruvate ferredoxin oxidoreductase [Deltaproteobacteria bacterium]
MKQVLEGSHAVSEAVRLARVQVVSAYPITPQTHIVEALSNHCASGSLDARFLCVESEHSALAAVIGASSGGVRAFTATSGQGLAYMHELLHWASGARLPIVMAEVNRALAPGWNIWADQTDSLSQRDTGWIQLYCEDGQEAFDTILMAFRLAEKVNLPVMVVLDAFLLSHTFEPVDIPDENTVDRFLPPFEPNIKLDTADPYALGQMVAPAAYMEMRHNIQEAMACVPGTMAVIEADFEKVFGRRYPAVEAVACGDADVVLAVSGTMAATCRQLIAQLRSEGIKAGMLKVKAFRPFPGVAIREVLAGVPKLAVVDRNFSSGAGGIFAREIRAELCNLTVKPLVYSYIAGLGGRDVTLDTLSRILRETMNTDMPPVESVWVDCG